MSLTVFELKPIVTKGDISIRDLTAPSIRYNYDPVLVGAYAVNSLSEMRPDLASRGAYGSADFWDLLLKYNGISNPFSLSTEDILLIPSLTDMKEQLADRSEPDPIGDAVRKQYIDVSKKAQLDPRLANIELKRRDAQRKKAEKFGVASVNNLPPNIAEEGSREIVIKGGKVYFGADVTKGKAECEVPLSKSEFIAKLIKNRQKNG